MTYEQFEKTIKTVIKQTEFETELNGICDKYGSISEIWLSPELFDVILELLEHIFHDEENQWIYYWMYEKDFGKAYKDGDVTDKEGNVIKLKTIRDLYDLLISNLKGEVNEHT